MAAPQPAGHLFQSRRHLAHFVERHGLLRIVCGAGAPISQYDEILVDPDACVRTAMGAALDILAKTIRPDLLMLERVRALTSRTGENPADAAHNQAQIASVIESFIGEALQINVKG